VRTGSLSQSLQKTLHLSRSVSSPGYTRHLCDFLLHPLHPPTLVPAVTLKPCSTLWGRRRGAGEEPCIGGPTTTLPSNAAASKRLLAPKGEGRGGGEIERRRSVCACVRVRAPVHIHSYMLCVPVSVSAVCVCVCVRRRRNRDSGSSSSCLPASSFPSSSMSNRCRRCAVAPEIKGGLT
jgi:hypothetical protein